jgi:hypothetical protein
MDTLFLTLSATYTQKCTCMSVSRHTTLYVTHSHTEFYETSTLQLMHIAC